MSVLLGACGTMGEFILGYADLSEEKIQDGVRRLGSTYDTDIFCCL